MGKVTGGISFLRQISEPLKMKAVSHYEAQTRLKLQFSCHNLLVGEITIMYYMSVRTLFFFTEIYTKNFNKNM